MTTLTHFFTAICSLALDLWRFVACDSYACNGGTWTRADDERLTRAMSEHGRGAVK